MPEAAAFLTESERLTTPVGKAVPKVIVPVVAAIAVYPCFRIIPFGKVLLSPPMHAAGE